MKVLQPDELKISYLKGIFLGTSLAQWVSSHPKKIQNNLPHVGVTQQSTVLFTSTSPSVHFTGFWVAHVTFLQTTLKVFLSQTHSWQPIFQVSPSYMGDKKRIIYTTSTNTLWIIENVYVEYHSIYLFRFAIGSSATLNHKNKQLTCILTKIHIRFFFNMQQKICLQEETQTSEVELNKVIPPGQKHPSPKELQFLFWGPSALHCWENCSLYLNKKSVKRYHYFRNRTRIYNYMSV